MQCKNNFYMVWETKKIPVTQFIAIRTSSQWSGAKPSVSLRSACKSKAMVCIAAIARYEFLGRACIIEIRENTCKLPRLESNTRLLWKLNPNNKKIELGKTATEILFGDTCFFIKY